MMAMLRQIIIRSFAIRRAQELHYCRPSGSAAANHHHRGDVFTSRDRAVVPIWRPHFHHSPMDHHHHHHPNSKYSTLSSYYHVSQQERTFATKRQKRVAAEAAVAQPTKNGETAKSDKPASKDSSKSHSGEGVSNSTNNSSTQLHSTLVKQPSQQKQQPLVLDRFGNLLPNSSFAEKLDDDFLAPSPLLDLSGVSHQSDKHQQLMPTAPTDWKGYEAATPLSDELIGRIVLAGRPLSIAEFMRAALTHPGAGYYTTTGRKHMNDMEDDDDFDQDDYDAETSTSKNELIGPAGDFVTAPEVSQVFGECLGVWFYTQWQQQQHHHQQQQSISKQQQQQQHDAAMTFQWLECGPGLGSLMVDLLQFCRQLQVPDDNTASIPRFWIHHCSAIHLVEASPILQAKQQEALEQWQLQLLQQNQKARRDVDDESSNQSNCPMVTFEFYNHKSSSNESSSMGKKSKVNVAHESKIANNTDSDSDLRCNTHCIPVHWHDSLQTFILWQQTQKQQSSSSSSLPPTFAVCQEFLDALPIYSFEKISEGYWRERLIDVALREDMMDPDEKENDDISDRTTLSSAAKTEEAKNQDSSSSSSISLPPQDKKPRLRIVLAPEATPALKTLLQADQEGFAEDPVLKDASVGSVVEVSPDSMIVMQDLAKIIKEQGGAALVIDYGQEGSTDSIRGFSKHKQVHFLSYPGQVDITADVDFAAMRHAVNHGNWTESSVVGKPSSSDEQRNEKNLARAFGPTDQGEFLIAMGMQERVIQLIERDDVTDEKAEDLYNAMVRLASSEEMGKRYKVMCIVPTSKDSDLPPPGFLQ